MSRPPALSIAEVPVALLAGGLATRLRPVSATIPKALVTVAGRPFIDHQIELLRHNGIRRVVLCLGHLGEQVEAHLGDGRALGMELRYSYDGDTLLGTGGAVRHALPHLSEAFWVMYGDSYMDIDYPAILDFFARSGAPGLMTVIRNDNRWDRSNVLFDDGRLLRYDKKCPTPEMNYIDYGVALLRRPVLERIPAGQPFDLADVYRELVALGRMVGYPVTRRFYEIGTPSGLEETRKYLAGRNYGREHVSPTEQYIAEATRILGLLDVSAIDGVLDQLVRLRKRGGRLFFLGVGGSAANASHAVNDFRKIAQIEAYAPTDNVSELTAWTNDSGWDTVFVNWLKESRLTDRDLVFVLSVGGGDLQRNVSPNLVRALEYARSLGAAVCGIVGRDGGYTAQVADACVIVPTVNPETITPHSEAFQAVIWHLLVSHPALKGVDTKWESMR